MDEWDHYEEVFQGLRKLEFLCGKFQGTKRTWFEWGTESATREETFEARWIQNGFYLQSSYSGRSLALWGYDFINTVYRQWCFAPYGHFMGGFPDPAIQSGIFQEGGLVFTHPRRPRSPVLEVEPGATADRSIAAMHCAIGSVHPRPPLKEIYKPERDGTFSVSLHVPKSGLGDAESFPGYYLRSEVQFAREDGPAE